MRLGPGKTLGRYSDMHHLSRTTKHRIPDIVCLCGSTKFKQAFIDAQMRETLAGRIVLSVGSYMHSDPKIADIITPAVKRALDELHKRKIDLCDEILVLNVDGYIGESTRGEIDYALRAGKAVRYLEPQHLLSLNDVRGDKYGG